MKSLSLKLQDHRLVGQLVRLQLPARWKAEELQELELLEPQVQLVQPALVPELPVLLALVLALVLEPQVQLVLVLLVPELPVWLDLAELLCPAVAPMVLVRLLLRPYSFISFRYSLAMYLVYQGKLLSVTWGQKMLPKNPRKISRAFGLT